MTYLDGFYAGLRVADEEQKAKAGEPGPFKSNDRLYWEREASNMLDECGLDYLAQSKSQTVFDVLEFAERYAQSRCSSSQDSKQ